MATQAAPGDGLPSLQSLLKSTRLDPNYDHDARFARRNAQDVHKEALDASFAHHEELRRVAERALDLHNAALATDQLRRRVGQEEERIRIEMLRAQEECRLRDIENQARLIPTPAPRVPTPPPAPAPAPPPKQPSLPPVQMPIPPPQPVPQPVPQAVFQPTPNLPSPAPITTVPQANPFQPSAPKPNPFPQVVTPHLPSQSLVKPAAPAATTTAVLAPVSHPPYILPEARRYEEIVRNLKQMKQQMDSVLKGDKTLKAKLSQLRREMSAEPGKLGLPTTPENIISNKKAISKVLGYLKQSLDGSMGQMGEVDPSAFMLSKPNPSPGAKYNGDTVPIQFIYFLNLFAKAIINQLLIEVGEASKPEVADQIGIMAVSIFANPELLWRGTAMIDILMARMRKLAPAIFGLRGNEKTEEGRTRLGWKRYGGHWVEKEAHLARMFGLGAGYAAITLRNFANSAKLKHPFPPYHYWQTMASIVSTPPGEASSTQYAILQGMTSGVYEGKFLAIYGSAARAALRIVLVDFPSQALSEHVNAARTLATVADTLERDQGFYLK